MNMKTLTLAAAALAVGSTGFAQNIVNITGATAFRTATLDTIKARYVASGSAFKLVHDQNAGNNQSFNGATLAIFEGTFSGVAGTTVIRTSFNGSVEGLEALVNSPASDPGYLQTNVLTSVTAAVGGNAENGAGNGKGGVSSPTETAQSHIAFSDVSRASTPFKNNPLQPASAAAGVVTFTMVGNASFPTNKVQSISAQNWRALLGNDGLPLSLITGDAADATKRAYATGRNDGSGTRTTYLAESQYGITETVKQFIKGGTNGATTNMTKIYKVPAGGTNAGLVAAVGAGFLSVSNASTIWGQDLDGNGGYSSGSALRGDLGFTTTNVTVYDADGSELETGIDAVLVTWLSTGDARSARTAGLGGKILGYDGVRLNDFAGSGTLSAADIAKVTNGSYTAWSFQQMYRRNDLTATNDPRVQVYNGIKNNLNLGSSGIAISAMAVGRPGDGGTVAP